MNIIILGAGQVGSSLAETLSSDKHNVTVIDINEQRLTQLAEKCDIQTIVGMCTYPSILRQANADNADMIIAVTSNDEANMVACQVAYSLFDIPRKIARIRSQHYFIRDELFSSDNLPIDVFISPESILTNDIKEIIKHPGALQVLSFSEGMVKLIAIKPFYNGPMTGKTVTKLDEHLTELDAKVIAIYRNDKSIKLKEDTTIEIGDEVFMIVSARHALEAMSFLKRSEEPNKRIIIAGGGNIGSRLAKALEKSYKVKIIEHNDKNGSLLANTLEHATVLKGNACDKALLFNENIEETDVFIALTNDDEDNIVASLQAKKMGARQVMTLITRTAYVDLIEGGSINIAISPQQATISSILSEIRSGDIVSARSLRRGAAEAIEVVAHGKENDSSVIGKSIKEIKIPKGVLIGAIMRKKSIIIPTNDTILQSGDHVIIFLTDPKRIKEIEKLFKASPSFF